MTSLTWQNVKLIQIAAKPPAIWNLALEWVPASRLLRFRVLTQDLSGAIIPAMWTAAPGVVCGPDGVIPAVARTCLFAKAQFGALIGKIGGSTADLPLAMDPAPTFKMFAVGSYAVYSMASDSGPLYLTMNDAVDNFHLHDGVLWVQIEECPL